MNWQPISTAPKDGTHILLRFYREQTMHVQTGVWRPNGNDMSTDPFWEYDPRWMKGNRSRRFQPTHWLPLPGSEGYPVSEAVAELIALAKLCRDVIDDDLENRPARHSLGNLHARLNMIIAKAEGSTHAR